MDNNTGSMMKFREYPAWMKAYYVFAIIFLVLYLVFLIYDRRIEMPSWLDYTARWGFLVVMVGNIVVSIIYQRRQVKSKLSK